MMTLQSWIASRYFRSWQRSRFLPMLTFVAIGGVTVGVMALIIVLSVMRGFSAELEKKIMGFNSHLTIIRTDGSDNKDISEIQNILPKESEVTPFVEGEAIAKTRTAGELNAVGVKVRGIVPDISLDEVEFYFPLGSQKFEELKTQPNSSTLPGIILGQEILAQLLVHPDFEDNVELVAPLAQIGPTGEMEPRVRTYKLIGVFRSGVFEYDNKVVFISVEEAKKLLGMQAQKGWQIKLSNPQDAPKVSLNLRQKLDEHFQIESWDMQNKKLFAALKLERYAMGSILFLIMLIASFSIIGVLMMVVSSKRKDVAIMRAVGMGTSQIRRIFLLYGMWIGTVGSLVGGLLGTCLCIILIRWPVSLPSSYYLNTLPVDLSFAGVFIFVLSGIVISMIAAFYPATQAAVEDPVVTLRYE